MRLFRHFAPRNDRIKYNNKPIDFTQQEISNYMILMDNIQNMFSMVIEEQFSFKIDDLRVYLVELCH